VRGNPQLLQTFLHAGDRQELSMELPPSKSQPNSSDQQMRRPNSDQRKNNVAQEMSSLRDPRQTNQTTHDQTREEPKLTPPSYAKHSQGHERKTNRRMSTDK